MAHPVRGRPPLWSLLIIVPVNLVLAPMVATWLGWLIGVLTGINSSVTWYYAVYIQPIRFAFLVLLSLAGLKLWQYLSFRNSRVGGYENGGVFALKAIENLPAACWLIIISSLSAGLILRVIALSQSFNYDEIVMVQNFVQSSSFDKAISSYNAINQHGLHAFLAPITARLLGEDEIALRLPAVIFGVASIYAIFTLGREWFGWRTGALSSLFLAFSLWHVYFSQEARGYSAAVFFAISSTFFLVQGTKRNSLEAWLLYLPCVALGIYSNLSFTFLALAHLGFVIHSAANLSYRRQRMVGIAAFSVTWLIASLASLILYAPVLKNLMTSVGLLMGTERVGFETLMVAYFAALGDILAWVSGDRYAISELAVLVAAVAGLGGLSRQDESGGIKRLFIWIIGISLAVILVLVARHFFFARFFIFILPFFVLAIARGVLRGADMLRPSYRMWASISLTLALLAPQLHGLWMYYQDSKQDIRGVAAYLKKETMQGDMIVVAGLGWQELTYYFDRPVYHPNSIQEMSNLARKQNPPNVYFVMLSGPEEKGTLARWARTRASSVRYFPPERPELPMTTIEVLWVQTPLVTSP